MKVSRALSLIIVALAVVVVPFLAAATDVSDAAGNPNGSGYHISEFVGDYWAKSPSDDKFEEVASIVQSNGGYVLRVYGDGADYTEYIINGMDGDSGEPLSYSTEGGDEYRITFNLSNSETGASASTIWFPVRTPDTGMMYVSNDLIGTGNHYLYRSGDIAVAGSDFRPLTLQDAVNCFSTSDDLDITLSDGTYRTSTDFKGESLTIRAATGASLVAGTPFSINGSGAVLEISGIAFHGDPSDQSECLVQFNHFKDVSITGCTFEDAAVYLPNTSGSARLTGNSFSSSMETVGNQPFAVTLDCADAVVSGNTIRGFTGALSVHLDQNGGDVEISGNDIDVLPTSDSNSVAFKVHGKIGGSSWDISGNDVSNTSSGLCVNSPAEGDPAVINSSDNTYRDCQNPIIFTLDADQTPPSVESVGDRAYEGGKEVPIVPVSTKDVPMDDVVDVIPAPEPEPSWSQDTYEDDLPPLFLLEQRDDPEETTTIVACAAAAVVAALMAVFLVVDRKP